MKKLYSKPEIMFESFTICASIAAGCENINTNPTKDVCAYKYKDDFGRDRAVFTSSIAMCTTKNDGDYNGICYDTPSENYNLFNS